jgi:hypothetical protein
MGCKMTRQEQKIARYTKAIQQVIDEGYPYGDILACIPHKLTKTEEDRKFASELIAKLVEADKKTSRVNDATLDVLGLWWDGLLMLSEVLDELPLDQKVLLYKEWTGHNGPLHRSEAAMDMCIAKCVFGFADDRLSYLFPMDAELAASYA